MPNWCTNTLTVIGTKKELDRFKKRYLLENGSLDFDKIIPEPRKIEDCPKGCIVDENSHIEIYADRPWFDWYRWHCFYWDTKWNACDTIEIESDDDHLVLRFDTAWDAPVKVIEALQSQNPSLWISLVSEYEDGGTIEIDVDGTLTHLTSDDYE